MNILRHSLVEYLIYIVYRITVMLLGTNGVPVITAFINGQCLNKLK